MFSLESPHRGDFNEHTQYTIFNIKKENHPKLSQICSYGFFYLGTQARVGNTHCERAISVRPTEVPLYMVYIMRKHKRSTVLERPVLSKNYRGA